MKVLLTFIFVLQTCNGLKLQLQIDVDDVIHTVDPYSPSVAMGLGIFERRWVDYFNDAKFMALARGLGASYLRVGGTKADVTTFITEATTDRMRNSVWNSTFCSSSQKDDHSFQLHKVWADQQLLLYDLRKQQQGIQRAITPVSFNESDWEKLNEFCSCAGWKLIFDLNLLMRNGSRWNYTNAQQLIKFTENRYHVNWELGNEPNSYEHKMGLYISPEQVGEGFNQLRKILQASPWWESSIIVGPDINRVGKFSAGNYLTRFLHTASNSVDKITVHQYDLNGRKATLNDFTNPDTLNGLVQQLQQILDVRAQWAPGKPIWLGETASAFGGGAKGLSDSYADGFPWLDKLGTAAKMGIDVVVRQTFLEASYALIDSDFNPLPDYWLTLLYKRLVGGKVLNTTLHQCKSDNCTLYDRSKVRIYAHCAKNKYRKGSIVIYFINLWSRKLHLALQPFAGLTGQGYLYLLEPSPPGNLTSKSIRLNGVTLKLSRTNTFPRLRPTRIDESKLKLGIKIPSFTYGFLVLSGANAPACINNGI